MIVAGSGATRTVRGTTVPTLISKLTLVTRGAEPVSTVWRIFVFCSVVNETLLPPPVVVWAVPDLEPPVDGDCDCCVVGVWPLFAGDCLVVGFLLLFRGCCVCCVFGGWPLFRCGGWRLGWAGC